MSKKNKVLKLLAEGKLSKARIAEKVGCSAAYVTIVSKKLDDVIYNASLGKQKKKSDVDAILDERGSRYGLYGTQAVVAQMLKDTVEHYMQAQKYEGDINHYFIVRETLQMICTKMARIINGDSTYADSWTDIAGYAQLVVDKLEGKER